jgi:outer membrane immunogenic protein
LAGLRKNGATTGLSLLPTLRLVLLAVVTSDAIIKLVRGSSAIQGMFDGSSMKGNSHKVVLALGPNVTDETRVPWFATLTGRIGYAAVPTVLLYAKGGVAWAHDRHEECCITSSAPFDDGFASVTRTGWTVGGGIEYMFLPSWSVSVEYDFLGFGSRSLTFTPTGLVTGPFVYDIRQNVQTVLFGLNYRFGSGKTPAPAVARY